MNFLSHKQKPPDPHISIHLDDACSAPFRPGSHIAGTASVQSPFPLQMQSGEAIFYGRAVTNCTRTGSMGTSYFRRANFSTNETVKYHDDACLFRLTQSLCRSFTLQPNQLYSWRFEFTFPHSANLIGPSPYHGPTASAGHYASQRHLLPPTFARYFNDTHYASVEYSVQVVFQSNDPAPLTIQLPTLDFLPHPGPPPNSSTSIECVRPPETFSSTRLMDERKSFGLSLRGKVSSSRSTSALVEVAMKTSLNTHVKQSCLMPILVSVEIDVGTMHSVSVHSMDISIKSLILCQITAFRARQIQGTSPMLEYQEIGDYDVLLNAQPSQMSVAAQTRPSENGETLLFPAKFETRIPGDVPPSFRTFNINHSYRLKVNVEAEIAGKTFEHKILTENLTVLPS